MNSNVYCYIAAVFFLITLVTFFYTYYKTSKDLKLPLCFGDIVAGLLICIFMAMFWPVVLIFVLIMVVVSKLCE